MSTNSGGSTRCHDRERGKILVGDKTADYDDSFTVIATGSLSGTLSGNPYGLVSEATHLESPMSPEAVAEGTDSLTLSGGIFCRASNSGCTRTTSTSS